MFFFEVHSSESNTERRYKFVLKWMGDRMVSGPVQTTSCLWGTWLLSINGAKEYIKPNRLLGTVNKWNGRGADMFHFATNRLNCATPLRCVGSTALVLSNPNFHTTSRAVIASSPGRFTPWKELLVPTGQTTWGSEQMLAMSNTGVGNYFNLRFKIVYLEMAVGSRTSQIQLRRQT